MAGASDWFATAARTLDGSNELCATLGIRPLHPLGGSKWGVPGLPGVVPLWTEGDWTFGLMFAPARDVQTWPAVMVWRGQAVTLASDAATLLPRFLVARHLSNFPDQADALKLNWRNIDRPLHKLHSALGGGEEALAEVASVVLDDRERARFQLSRGSREEFEAAHETLLRAIDRSPGFTAFADWFSARLRGARTEPRLADFGNWSRQALAWSLQFDVAGALLPDDLSSLAPLVTEHCGWDTALSVAPSWYDPGSGGSLGLLAMSAQLILTGAALSDPIDQRIVDAAGEGGTSYDGIVHADAVPELDAKGEAERAWGALCAAAWWMWTRRGEVPTAITDGVRLLASQHGWNDLLWIMEQNAGASV